MGCAQSSRAKYPRVRHLREQVHVSGAIRAKMLRVVDGCTQSGRAGVAPRWCRGVDGRVLERLEPAGCRLECGGVEGAPSVASVTCRAVVASAHRSNVSM